MGVVVVPHRAYPRTEGARVLGVAAVPTAVGETTDPVTLATVPVEPPSMGINGILRITVFVSFTGSTNSKSIEVKFGGVSFFTNSTSNANDTMWSGTTIVRNEGATNAQVGYSAYFRAPAGSGVLFGSSGNPNTSAIDTLVAQNVEVIGQKANSGEAYTLRHLLVELIR